VFIAAQFALILRLPIPSYLLWAVVAAVGAAIVLSYAILAEYFPKELAGRANGALNLLHIATAFVVQYATGVVLAHWTPQAGQYPEMAYSDSLCAQSRPPDRGVGLVRASASPNALAAAKAHAIQRSRFDPDGPLRLIHQ
jgi:MFS family permease